VAVIGANWTPGALRRAPSAGGRPCAAYGALQSVVAAVLVLVALWPAAAGGEDPFRTLSLIRPARLEAAPDFTAPGLTSRAVRLSALTGQVVFLNFWATWCPPCREEMPSMDRLYRRFKARGFTVVAVSIDAGGAAVVAPFVKELGLTFPIALDPKLEVANQYRVRSLPTTVLIDRPGQLAGVALGPRDWDGPAAHAVIEALLK
jgi:peroxiredoxin